MMMLPMRQVKPSKKVKYWFVNDAKGALGTTKLILLN